MQNSTTAKLASALASLGARLALLAALGLGAVGLGACTPSVSASGDDGGIVGRNDGGIIPGNMCCSPGDALSCKCMTGQTGQATCIAAGVGFSPCECPGLGTAPTTPADEFVSANHCGDCEGCCDGTTCVKLGLGSQSKGTCGARIDCTVCEGPTQCESDVGICTVTTQPDCDATTCAGGCCLNNRCLPQTGLACGIAGGACTPCAKGTLCDSAGVCSGLIDPAANVKLVLKSIALATNSCSGNVPKLSVCVRYEQSTPYVQKLQGCSSVCAPGTSCSPVSGMMRSADSPVFYPGRALQFGFEVQVWDNAASPPRLLARDKVAGVSNLSSFGNLGAFGQVSSLTMAAE